VQFQNPVFVQLIEGVNLRETILGTVTLV